MNQTANTAKKRTWQPIRTGAFILGLGMALGACQKEATDEAPGTPPMPDTTMDERAKPIHDVDAIVGAADRAMNVNRQVELAGTEVQRVASDRIFWVGSKADRAVPVYLEDEALASLTSMQEHVETGDRVTLVGELKRTPTTDDLQKQWKLTAQDAEQVHRAQVYIHARRISLAEQPAQPGQPREPAEQPPGQPGGEPGGQPGGQPGQPGQPGGQPGQPSGQPEEPREPGEPGEPGKSRPGEFQPGKPATPGQFHQGQQGQPSQTHQQ